MLTCAPDCRDLPDSSEQDQRRPEKPAAAWTSVLSVWKNADQWRHLNPEKVTGKCPGGIDLVDVFGPYRKSGAPFAPPSGSWDLRPQHKLTAQQEENYDRLFQFKPF